MATREHEAGMRADQRYLTTADLAAHWQLSRWTIRQLAKAGRIRGAERVGRDWRFREDALLVRVADPPTAAPSTTRASAAIERLLVQHRARRKP
jgi:excisionase family DNA binding protein